MAAFKFYLKYPLNISIFFSATSKYATPSFRGNSYLVVPPPRIPIKDKRTGPVLYMRSKEIVKISLNFSTIHLDGLLFWTSRDKNKFLGLGIEAGHIKLASNLLDTESNTLDIPTGGFVADGAWHNVQIEIDKKVIELSIDSRPIFTENKKTVDLTNDKMDLLAAMMEDLFYIGKYLNEIINSLPLNCKLLARNEQYTI